MRGKNIKTLIILSNADYYIEYSSSTKTLVLLGLCQLLNSLILARRFRMTMDRYWRHANLPMANGW